MTSSPKLAVDLNLHRPVHQVLGLPFDAVSLDQAASMVHEAVRARKRLFISTPNVNFVVAASQDAQFAASIWLSDLSLMDGMPLVWWARWCGLPFRERVAGATLFEYLQRDSKHPMKIYFFGGPDGVAAKAAQKLNESCGPLRCVGFESPGFGTVAQMSTEEQIDRINASGADFLVVALGARKGQDWILHNLDRLEVPVISHLGAVVNFVAGSVSRAPRWMQSVGLEWLWRIKQEPGLYRRYVLDAWAMANLLRKGRYGPVLPDQATLGSTGQQTQVRSPQGNMEHERLKLTVDGSAPRARQDLIALLQPHVRDQRNVMLELTETAFRDSVIRARVGLFRAYRQKLGFYTQLTRILSEGEASDQRHA